MTRNVIYLNAQSYLANKSEIDRLLYDEKPSVLCLSEARVTHEVEDTELQVANYNLLRCNSETRHTGGVIVFVHHSLKCNINQLIQEPSKWWLLSVSLSYKNGSYV